MIINILLGAAIFGYAGWTLYKYINNSRKGKCAACKIKENCSCHCSNATEEKMQ